MKQRPPKLDSGRAEEIAILGLGFLAGDEDRLGRFLALTGAGPEALAKARTEPDVLASVLEYLLGDEQLLVEFADQHELAPASIQTAWDLLVYADITRRRPQT